MSINSNVTEEQIIKCARILLESTTNIYLRDLLEDLIVNGNALESERIYRVIAKICLDGYDITGYGLWEIPHDSVFVFCKTAGGNNEEGRLKNNEMFDIYTDYFNGGDIEVTIGRLNDEANTENCQNIADAIYSF